MFISFFLQQGSTNWFALIELYPNKQATDWPAPGSHVRMSQLSDHASRSRTSLAPRGLGL